MKAQKGRGKRRRYTAAFRLKAVQRMEAGESVAPLSRALGVRRKLLYEWRERYRKEGNPGLERGPGQRRQRPQQGSEQEGQVRIAQLEQKVGRQALLIDFLQHASKRVEESRRSNSTSGGKASTEKSGA